MAQRPRWTLAAGVLVALVALSALAAVVDDGDGDGEAPEPAAGSTAPDRFLDAWARSREATFRSVSDFTRVSNSTGAELTDRVLRAFVDTVVPGLPRSEPHPVRVFSDDFFPFARFRGYFASDLCRRAGDLSGVDAFDRLTPAQRTRVVRAGSESGGVTGQLYTGAIVLVQAATYGGIYDAAGDVPFIDFQGFRYGASDPGACSYPDPHSFLAPTLARDGNPA